MKCNQHTPLYQQKDKAFLFLSQSLLSVKVRRERAFGGEVLDVASIWLKHTSGTLLNIFLSGKLGESPLVGDDNLLTPSKLVLASTEGLNNNGLVGVLCANRNEDLTNVDTGRSSLGFSPGTSHSLLESFSYA